MLGILFVKWGILTSPAAHMRTLRRLLFWGLSIGIPLNFYTATLAITQNIQPLTGVHIVGYITHHIGSSALMVAYLAAIVMIWEKGGSGAWWLRLFASLGRMSLSAYVGQSLLMYILLCVWFPALYGKIGPTALMGITTIIIPLQMFLSWLWLRYCGPLGPLEWFWRMATVWLGGPWTMLVWRGGRR